MSDNSTPSVRFDGFTNDWEQRQASRNVPAVRFKADDGSDFPDWEKKKLGDVGKFIRGLSYDKTLVDDDGQTLVLRSTNILESGSLDYHHDLQFVNKTPASSQVLQKNDVVICMANGSTHLVGKSAQYDGNSSVITTVGAFCSIFRSELVIAGLLFQTKEYARAINYLVEGGDGALANLKANSLAKITFHIPTSPEEQQRIASLLSSVDETLYLCQRKLDLLTQAKKALMQQIFSQKLRFKADDGSDFPDWEEKKLGDILQQYKEMASKDGTYPHVSLTKGGVVPKTERYNRDFLVRQQDKQYRVTHKDDICYNPANLKFGVICRNKYGDGIFSPIYITYRVSEGNIPQFVEALVTRDDFIGRALRFQEGTVYERMAVSPEDFEKMKVQLPSLPEQQKIASCLSSADALIDQARTELEQWQEVKKSLLQQMFV